MICVISPAKSMSFDPIPDSFQSSYIQESGEMRTVLRGLKKLSVSDIMDVMKVSRKIAELNYNRFNSFDKQPEKQALFAYRGDVYKNIDIKSLNEKAIDFAQGHLRIVSALYGLLRPLDMIKAYRLEMSCRLSNIDPKGMSAFWSKKITTDLNKEFAEHKNQYLINLASNEYSAAINTKDLNADIVNIHFREVRNGSEKNIALKSKRARGMMADFIIRNHLDTPEDIKKFSINGYVYSANLSDFNNYYFIC